MNVERLERQRAAWLLKVRHSGSTGDMVALRRVEKELEYAQQCLRQAQHSAIMAGQAWRTRMRRWRWFGRACWFATGVGIAVGCLGGLLSAWCFLGYAAAVLTATAAVLCARMSALWSDRLSHVSGERMSREQCLRWFGALDSANDMGGVVVLIDTDRGRVWIRESLSIVADAIRQLQLGVPFSIERMVEVRLFDVQRLELATAGSIAQQMRDEYDGAMFV